MYGILVLEWNELITWPLHKFEKFLTERRVALKTITGYEFDSNHYCFHDICGYLYAFSVNKRTAVIGVYDIHVWDYRGQQTIYSKAFCVGQEGYNKTIPDDVANELDTAIKLYRDAETIQCSDCGEPTLAKSGRRYFAGTYCEGCWAGTKGQHKDKGGWNKVEAKETYN